MLKCSVLEVEGPSNTMSDGGLLERGYVTSTLAAGWASILNFRSGGGSVLVVAKSESVNAYKSSVAEGSFGWCSFSGGTLGTVPIVSCLLLVVTIGGNTWILLLAAAFVVRVVWAILSFCQKLFLVLSVSSPCCCVTAPFYFRTIAFIRS